MILQVLTLISKGTLAGKGAAMALGAVAAIAGWSMVESFATKNWVGLIVSGACLIIVTKIKTRPKIIQAETERMVSEARISNEVITMTKHAQSGLLNAAEMHLRLRGDLLRQHGIEFLSYQPIDPRIVTQDEDRNRARIAGLEWKELDPDELALPPI